MKNKKIAVFYQGAHTHGGIETYLEKMFENVDKKQVDLYLVSLGRWPFSEKLKKAGYNVIIFDQRWYQLTKLNKLAGLVNKEGFSLLISQVMVANFYARLISRKTGIPQITVVHSDTDYDYPSGVKRLIFLVTDRLLRKYTRKYIVVSEYLKNKLIKRGIQEEIQSIYTGVSKIDVKNKKVDKKVIIGSVGRLTAVKNFHNLVLASKYLKNDFEIRIWGDGEEKTSLEELISKNQLQDKVKLMGWQSLETILGQIDIYIQASISEGFGLVVVEAMISGKPVIVTPVGSLPELVKDGKTGIISRGTTPETIAVAINVLLEDAKLLKELPVRAREEALKRFSIERWMDKMTKAFIEATK